MIYTFTSSRTKKSVRDNKRYKKEIEDEKNLLEDIDRINELLGLPPEKGNSGDSVKIKSIKKTKRETEAPENKEDSMSDLDKAKLLEEEKEKKKLFLQLDEMRSRVLPHSREIMAEHREEIFHAIEVFLKVVKIARHDGLVPLERETEILSKSAIQSDQMFAAGLQAMIDDFWTNIAMEKMFGQFPINSNDIYMDFMLYCCIRVVIAMQEGLSDSVVKKLCLSMIPLEEHKALEEYLKYGIYVINGRN